MVVGPLDGPREMVNTSLTPLALVGSGCWWLEKQGECLFSSKYRSLIGGRWAPYGYAVERSYRDIAAPKSIGIGGDIWAKKSTVDNL